VKVLSGGERNRLLLAKLFTRPSNVLVLDEPTNDLDIETLDLLEELLSDYPGTVLLVSHDRAFINDVVTSTLVLEGKGKVSEYVGGYDDWLLQSRRKKEVLAPAALVRTEEKKSMPVPPKEKARKLTFKEQKELETLPQRIEELDQEQQRLIATMADPAFYRESGNKVANARARLEAVEKELAGAFKRWEELEAMKA
jgi:ATP-binding cassette subfamily F protein uup